MANIALRDPREPINQFRLITYEVIEMSESYTKVGQLGDFPAGSLRRVRVGKDDVVVANVDGKLYAITATCTHRGGPLDEGELKGTVVICPWHGGQFDLASERQSTPLQPRMPSRSM